MNVLYSIEELQVCLNKTSSDHEIQVFGMQKTINNLTV